MAKRTVRGAKSRKKDKTIKQNRPKWRKKVIGQTKTKVMWKSKKIKGKEWEQVK